jgi:uncharacterized membrane protein
MPLPPEIAIHAAAAIGAVVTGPVALWARKGRVQRPRLHRAFGYAWVTLMTITAISALFISGSADLPHLGGYSPIHLLVPVTLFGLFGSFVMLARGNIDAHRKIMQRLYIGACLVAGFFTLVPGRLLGNLLWVDLLGIASPHMHNPLPPGETSMIVQFLGRTPLWVWPLLAALIALGLSQARARSASLARITVMPVAMTGFSVWGTVSAFGGSPMFGYVMLAWMFAAAVMLAVVAPTALPRGTAYDVPTRTFSLPGSWGPLVLILGIFLTKYAVGATLALQPGMARHGLFALAVGGLYGLFSGIFAGRAARLWRLAYQFTPLGQPVLAP